MVGQKSRDGVDWEQDGRENVDVGNDVSAQQVFGSFRNSYKNDFENVIR